MDPECRNWRVRERADILSLGEAVRDKCPLTGPGGRGVSERSGCPLCHTKCFPLDRSERLDKMWAAPASVKVDPGTIVE